VPNGIEDTDPTVPRVDLEACAISKRAPSSWIAAIEASSFWRTVGEEQRHDGSPFRTPRRRTENLVESLRQECVPHIGQRGSVAPITRDAVATVGTAQHSPRRFARMSGTPVRRRRFHRAPVLQHIDPSTQELVPRFT